MENVNAQARELYKLCDPDNRGYLTRNDLTRLKDFLPLDEEQLDAVFTSLDQDGDEHLTFDEFSEGLGPYLGSSSLIPATPDPVSRKDSSEESEGEESFKQSLNYFGGASILNEVEPIREVWKKLRRENPALLQDFEKLLKSLACELTQSKTEYEGLESALKKRINAHDEEVRRLYEEMESQIKQEREKLLANERIREKELRETLEEQIREKDKHLQELMRVHEDTQSQLEVLNNSYSEATQKKQELDQERMMLEQRLEETEMNLKECQDYIEVLGRKARDERRVRARAAMELSEGIALERETLVRQLQELREVNRRLRDERDEGLIRMGFIGHHVDSGGESLYAAMQSASHELAYNATMESHVRPMTVRSMGLERTERLAAAANMRGSMATAAARRGSTLDAYFGPSIAGQSTLSSTDDASIIEEGSFGEELTDSILSAGRKRSYVDSIRKVSIDSHCRPSPDGATDQGAINEEAFMDGGPEGVFKIVSIGNSGVGKTSLLHQFSTGVFNSRTATTVGVDVQIRRMKVDGKSVILQLWDTAGQEKYRSITRQYFRKADGIVIVYDVTSEVSFLDLRSWMQSVEDGVEFGTPVMFLANKIDLITEGIPAKVSRQAGERLAKEFDAIFFEISAKTGENIEAAFAELVRRLKMQEDKRLSNLLKLETKPFRRKKGCCIY